MGLVRRQSSDPHNIVKLFVLCLIVSWRSLTSGILGSVIRIGRRCVLLIHVQLIGILRFVRCCLRIALRYRIPFARCTCINTGKAFMHDLVKEVFNNATAALAPMGYDFRYCKRKR